MNTKATTPEALLAQAGRLKSLALRLVKDESQADDVIQQTLLQAIRRPPRDAQAMGAWLARVARNEARQLGRSERARGRREQRVGRAGTAPATVDIVARAELHRRLVDAVLAIEEPFRTVVLLRYFDGVEPKRIAEQLGWPPATVRTRLKRGLDRLRVAMDERSGGDRRAWTLSLLAFVDPKDLAGAGAALTTAAAAGVIVSTKTKLVALAVLFVLALGAVIVFSPGAGDEDPGSGTRTASDTNGRETDDPRLEGRLAQADDAPEQPTVPAASPALERPRVTLQFTDGFGRELTASAIRQRFEAAGLPPQVVVVSEGILAHTDMAAAAVRTMIGSTEGRTTASWSWAEEGLGFEIEPGAWRLFVARPGAAPLLTDVFRVEDDGALASVEIPLPAEVPSAMLRLRAADTDAPLAGARLVPYFEFGDDLAFFEGAALTADDTGEIRVPRMDVTLDGARGRGPTWWVVAPGRLARVPPMALREDGSQTVRVPRTAEVEGKAYRQDGQPAAGLQVVWARKGRTLRVTVGDDGSFRIQGLPTERSSQLLFLIEDAETMRIARARVQVAPGKRTEGFVIGTSAATSPRALLQGTITAGGHPIAGAMVLVRPAGQSSKEGPLAKTDADGRYRLSVAAGRFDLRIYFGGADDFYVRSIAPLELEQGQERALDFDLPGGALLVTLLDAETGAPIPGGGAYAAPANREAAVDRFPGFTYRAGSAATTGADGTALLHALVPGESHTLETRAGGYARWKQEDVLPSGAGEPPVRLTVRLQRP